MTGLTASDISKAERGEKTLTQEQLKGIAKATGVTQKSLLEASAGKTSSTSSTETKTTSLKLTAAEKKLVTLYRKADADTKAAAIKLLEEKEESSLGSAILESLTGGDSNVLGNLLSSALGALTNNGKKDN